VEPIKISVIIPTHNRHDKLAETVACLRHQTLPVTDYEILVIDDGSTPPVVLTGELENLTCHVIRLEGVERSITRNTGAQKAKGEILLFVDDDMKVNKDFLVCHLYAHQKWPGSLVVGAVRLPDESLLTSFGRFRQMLELQEVPVKSGLVSAPNFCTAQNMSILKSRFGELGGFDEHIVSSEDQELALRHTSRDGKIVFALDALTIHDDHSLDIQSYCKRVAWGNEYVIPFCQQYPDWPQNIERQRINGALRFGQEPFGLSLRKMVKSVLAQKPFLKGLFALTFFLERTMPQSTALDRLYRLLLGIHLQKGYRKGLQRFNESNMQRRGLTARIARRNA
jgi:GT2 family glycosyltransferase